MGALSGIGLNHQVVLAVLELTSKHAEITIFRHGRCRRRQELGHAFLKAIAVAANLSGIAAGNLETAALRLKLSTYCFACFSEKTTERQTAYYPDVRSRKLTDQQPRAQSGMEHILDHSGMGSIGTSSITRMNESESPDRRPQPPTPPSEVVSSDMLDRAVGDPSISQAHKLLHANAARQEHITVCQPAASPISR